MKTSNKLILAPIAIILLGATILLILGRIYSVPVSENEKAQVEMPAPPAPPAVPDAPGAQDEAE